MLKVRVRVPATAANLGAGYNCLGLALQLYNTIWMQDARSGLKIEIAGEGKDCLPKDERNLVFQSAYEVFRKCSHSPKGLSVRLENHIPVARGLGSSTASVVAAAIAANELCKRRFYQEELIELCAELEGHPENVVPAFLGGLAICGYNNDHLIYKHFLVRHGLRAIIAIPKNLEVKTKDAIAILPKNIPIEDAVFNISRAAFFISGILEDDLKIMGLGMEDRLHQSYRKALVPGLEDVLKAARHSGAHGVALSGCGPSVIAITNRYPQPVGEAMRRAFMQHGIESKTMSLDADNEGARIWREK